jgi:hypothetical protein
MNVYIITTKGMNEKMNTYKYKNDRRRHRVADGEAAATPPPFSTYSIHRSVTNSVVESIH